MSENMLIRALLHQIDVNFALMNAVLQVIIEAELPETERLKSAIDDVSNGNGQLIELTKKLMHGSMES